MQTNIPSINMFSALVLCMLVASLSFTCDSDSGFESESAKPITSTFTFLEDWAAQYNGSGNNTDAAKSIAVDQAGNVYVTGSSYGGYYDADYATVKYDNDGVMQWAARYSGPGINWDSPYAIAVDQTGNAYVTGYSHGGDSGNDYTTIKYDSDGQEQWVARYDGTAGKGDTAHDIAVDDSGNVFVTGYSAGASTGNDYVTIKYDSNGAQQWVARYDGTGSDQDRAYALALDLSGNVYVTGASTGNNGIADYTTIKYAPNGTEQWVARYDGPGNDEDTAFGLTLDSSGNIVVTGWSIGIGSGYDYATLKYDENGTEIWMARYDGPGNGDDSAISIAVDLSNNIYITGNSKGDGTKKDFATIKYDGDGKEQWVSRYDGSIHLNDSAASIAVDQGGNTYVTGFSDDGNYEDFLTVKYDSNGQEQWVAKRDGAGHDTDRASSIVLDDFGNVYVTGESFGDGTDFDYLTVKYIQQCEGCVIDFHCYQDSETNPENQCKVCDIFESDTSWTDNEGGQCDDGLWCNGGDTCQGGSCSEHSGDPCEVDEICNEDTDSCELADDDDDNDDSGDDDDSSSPSSDDGDDDDSGCCG